MHITCHDDVRIKNNKRYCKVIVSKISFMWWHFEPSDCNFYFIYNRKGKNISGFLCFMNVWYCFLFQFIRTHLQTNNNYESFYFVCFLSLLQPFSASYLLITMSLIIETLFLSGIVLLVLFASGLINVRKLYYSLKLPGPIPLPILGNGLLFLNKSPAGKC